MNHRLALLMGKPLWAVALAMALALPSALAQAPAKPAPKTLPGSAWKIDFGRGVTGTVFLFCKKGRWEIVPQRAGSIGAIGTSYKESGNTLTTVNSAGGQTEKWAMSRDGEVLVLNDGTTTLRLHYNGETQC